MKPYYEDDSVTLYHGDALKVLQSLPDSSVDSVVTDPPYGLGFMGKAWDDRPPGLPFAAECLRVLKPGGHMLAFGGTRTWHRLACAVEDAGFEIRDSIAWIYGSGFPKATNIASVLEAQSRGYSAESKGVALCVKEDGGEIKYGPTASRWTGWKSALRPSFEPIVVGRRPLHGSIASNVASFGVGGFNVDANRIETTHCRLKRRAAGTIRSVSNGIYGLGGCVSLEELCALAEKGEKTPHGEPAIRVLSRLHEKIGGWEFKPSDKGRYAPNVLLDESQADALAPENRNFFPVFRYESKAPSAERPRVGLTAHPTVKPLDLMRWLVRLVTPPDGTVLEPFAGSGTTVEACIIEGFHCIAIEREADYLPLITQRINRRRDPVAAVKASGEDPGLFDLLDGDDAA